MWSPQEQYQMLSAIMQSDTWHWDRFSPSTSMRRETTYLYPIEAHLYESLGPQLPLLQDLHITARSKYSVSNVSLQGIAKLLGITSKASQRMPVQWFGKLFPLHNSCENQHDGILWGCMRSFLNHWIDMIQLLNINLHHGSLVSNTSKILQKIPSVLFAYRPYLSLTLA